MSAAAVPYKVSINAREEGRYGRSATHHHDRPCWFHLGRYHWCSLLLFIVAGIIGMMAQTMLPANLGYPQLHDSGVPTWLTWTVVGLDVVAFFIPPLVTTSCGRKAKRLGHPVRSAVQISWATFTVVTVISFLLVFFG